MKHSEVVDEVAVALAEASGLPTAPEAFFRHLASVAVQKVQELLLTVTVLDADD